MQQKQLVKSSRMFTASEVAEFEYCPLSWWYEQFEPWVQVNNEGLFARMVELEHEHGAQAPAVPEYQMLEQLLLRREAFDEGSQQHREHADAVEDAEQEVAEELRQGKYNLESAARGRTLMVAIVVLGILALLLIIGSLLLH